MEEKRAVKIEDGVVTNVIVIDDNTPKSLYDVKLKSDEEASVGWKYEDEKFIAPPQESPEDASEE